MGNPVDTMRRTLAELEAQREQIDATITQLRTMLASWTGGQSDAKSSSGRGPAQGPREARNGNARPALVFEKKYELSSRDLIGTVLRESSQSLNAGTVTKKLAARGYDFSKQTIALGLKQLVTTGKVKRVKSPSGSGHTWMYSWIEAELPFGAEREANA